MDNSQAKRTERLSQEERYLIKRWRIAAEILRRWQMSYRDPRLIVHYYNVKNSRSPIACGKASHVQVRGWTESVQEVTCKKCLQVLRKWKKLPEEKTLTEITHYHDKHNPNATTCRDVKWSDTVRHHWTTRINKVNCPRCLQALAAKEK